MRRFQIAICLLCCGGFHQEFPMFCGYCVQKFWVLQSWQNLFIHAFQKRADDTSARSSTEVKTYQKSKQNLVYYNSSDETPIQTRAGCSRCSACAICRCAGEFYVDYACQKEKAKSGNQSVDSRDNYPNCRGTMCNFTSYTEELILRALVQNFYGGKSAGMWSRFCFLLISADSKCTEASHDYGYPIPTLWWRCKSGKRRIKLYPISGADYGVREDKAEFLLQRRKFYADSDY